MMELLKRVWASPKARSGCIVFICVLAFGLIGPLLLRTRPTQMVGELYERPSAQHWLGTDNFGRDVFTQLAYGTRTSLEVGLLAGLIATLIGTAMGSTAGYKGGLADAALNSITNLFLVIPPFVVLILLSISLRTRSVAMLAVIIGVTSWPWVSRSVRAQVYSLKTRRHVDMARISGFGMVAIIVREILPYVLSYIVMAFVLQVASGILTEATLSMLRLGPYDAVSLGTMMSWALMYEAVRTRAWWAFIPPVLLIAIITFSLKYINSGMDEVFNPRLRRA
jgi:peptide/nickel transport system permease protein